MSLEVDWSYLAWSDLTGLHWRTAGTVCRGVYDFAVDGTGTLRRLAAEDRIGATHALLVPPFKVYVSLVQAEGVLRVWRVRRARPGEGAVSVELRDDAPEGAPK